MSRLSQTSTFNVLIFSVFGLAFGSSKLRWSQYEKWKALLRLDEVPQWSLTIMKKTIFFPINSIDIRWFFNYYCGPNCGITRRKKYKKINSVVYFFLCYIEIKDKADTFDIVYIIVVHAKITPKKAKSCIAITASSQNHNLYYCNFPFWMQY